MRAFFRDAVSEVTNRVTASRIVSKATSSSDKLELDDEEAFEVANFANTISPTLIISNIKSRLDSKTPASQYLTMRLIQYLVDHCSFATHTELAKDVSLHQRLIQLASSLQEAEPGAARTAIKVRLEARKLLLELSRTFQGSAAPHAPLSTLGGKFEAMTQKKLERSVLMAPQRIRFRPPTDDDIRLISPRGKRGSLTAFRKEQEELLLAAAKEKERLAADGGGDGQEDSDAAVGGGASSSSTVEGHIINSDVKEAEVVLTGSIVTENDNEGKKKGGNHHQKDESKQVIMSGQVISNDENNNNSDNNDDDDQQHNNNNDSSSTSSFTSPGDPLTAEEKNHPKLHSPRGASLEPGQDEKNFVAAALHHSVEEDDNKGVAKNGENNTTSNDTAEGVSKISDSMEDVDDQNTDANTSTSKTTTFIAGQLIDTNKTTALTEEENGKKDADQEGAEDEHQQVASSLENKQEDQDSETDDNPERDVATTENDDDTTITSTTKPASTGGKKKRGKKGGKK